MNTFGFLLLLKRIFGKKLPDLAAIQKQGLLAVKIAQHFALRVDFLDERVCRHLSRLFQAADSAPDEDVRPLLEQFQAQDSQKRITEISLTPFASASLGQVHSATLSSGQPAIVKLIKFTDTKKFIDDIRRIRRFVRLICFFYPKLRRVADPVGILDYIESYTLTELDLRNEIAGAEELRDVSEKYGQVWDFSALALPRFYPEESTSRILLVERVIGKTFNEHLDAGTLSYDTLLEFFKIHGFFMFVPGIFHGDIHPGNVMLGDDGRIFLIDTGALSKIDPVISRGLFYFMKELAFYRIDACAKILNSMSKQPLPQKSFERFLVRMKQLYATFPGKTVSEVSMTRQMMQTIKLGINCGMDFGTGIFPIIKSMMYLDGMVLRCKPNAVLMEDMRPFILQFENALSLVEKEEANR